MKESKKYNSTEKDLTEISEFIRQNSYHSLYSKGYRPKNYIREKLGLSERVFAALMKVGAIDKTYVMDNTKTKTLYKIDKKKFFDNIDKFYKYKPL